VSQVRPLVPNFTIVALELTSTEIDKIWNFLVINLPLRGQSLKGFFNKIWLRREIPRFAPSGQISPLWL